MGDGTLDQCQTDTDPSGRLCILADIHVRARTTSRTHYIRVKVDPGTDANLMPLHHFREIFPYLCDKNGKPKEGVLEKAESSFESYSSDNVSVIGQMKIYAKNKHSAVHDHKDLHDCQRGPILLGNAACQWLGLIAVGGGSLYNEVQCIMGHGHMGLPPPILPMNRLVYYLFFYTPPLAFDYISVNFPGLLVKMT